MQQSNSGEYLSDWECFALVVGSSVGVGHCHLLCSLRRQPVEKVLPGQRMITTSERLAGVVAQALGVGLAYVLW